MKIILCKAARFLGKSERQLRYMIKLCEIKAMKEEGLGDRVPGRFGAAVKDPKQLEAAITAYAAAWKLGE